MSYLVAFDLAEDVRHGGCPMCRAMCRVGDAYLRTLLATDIGDRRVRERIKLSGGMCREHVLVAAEIAAKTRDHVGMAVLDEWLLEVAEGRLGEGPVVPTIVRRWRHRAASRAAAPCPACESESVIVDSYVQLLIADPARAHRAAEAGEFGICLPHALRVLELAAGRPARRMAVALWTRRAERLRGLLADLIASQSVPPRELSDPAAQTSWLDAAEWVAGASRRSPSAQRPSR